MDREVLSKRLETLRSDLEEARAQVYALTGAIQQCEWTLRLFDESTDEETGHA